MEEGDSQECIQVEAIRIPSSMEKHVEAVTLCMSLREHYLDIIANELGLEDGANVLISRYDVFTKNFRKLDNCFLTYS